MVASIGSRLKFAAEVGLDELFRRFQRRTDDDVDAALCEELLRPLAHPASDDQVDTLLVKPPWQQAWFVWRRSHQFGLHGVAVLLLDIDQGKLLTVSKMHAQAAVGRRDGDLHTLFLQEKVIDSGYSKSEWDF